jgi:signal peptidase I
LPLIRYETIMGLMLSLLVFVATVFTFVVVAAAITAWAARAVGSSRGRFRFGLGFVLLVFVLNVAINVGLALVPSASLPSSVVLAVAGLLLGLVFVWMLAAKVFGLSRGRAAAPLGAYVAAGIAYVALAWTVLRPYAVEGFSMPTQSMAPTIVPGDRFFVNKLSTPRRWDLVAYVNDDGVQRAIFCKRLIGLPGERLRFEGGDVFVNDQRQPAPAVVDKRYTMAFGSARSLGRYKDGETVQLGPDEFFLVGDYVDISADSRVNGPTDRSKLVGVADLRYWPISRAGLLQ